MERIVLDPRVKKTKTCWLWQGSISPKGYGQVSVRGSRVPGRVHRVAYEQEVGPIPKGLNVLHDCDVRNCLNPAHLRVGTQQDNVDDMMKRGRQDPVRDKWTHCSHGHEFTPKNTGYRKNAESGRRYCRECKRLRSAGLLPAWGNQ